MLFGMKSGIKGSYNPAMRDTSLRTQLTKILTILILLLSAHTFAMIHFEGMDLGEAIWLTLTTVTTVGYGEVSAHTVAGRVSTVLLLYIGGIGVLAQALAMYFEYRQEVINLIARGAWVWKMENHIVFIGYPEHNGDEYYYKAISALRKSNTELSNLPIILVSRKLKYGISDRLRKLNVVYVHGNISDEETWEASNITKAHSIVILARDSFDPLSDSINFELIDRLRSKNVKGRIITEAVRDESRARLRKVGADNILRPIRTYPEILVRAIVASGSEHVIETLFYGLGEECVSFLVNVKATWLEIATKIIKAGIGTPIAYETPYGSIVNNPSADKDKKIETKAVFVIVSEGNMHGHDDVTKILNAD